MSKVFVKRPSADNLTQELWEFAVVFDMGSLSVKFVLDSFSKMRRETPRHKFKSYEWYTRTGDHRTAKIQDPKELVIPDDVVAEAKVQVVRAVMAAPVKLEW